MRVLLRIITAYESVVRLNYCYDLADRGQFSFLIVR